MRLTLHAAHETPHGALRLVQAMGVQSGKPDVFHPAIVGMRGRVYGHTTTGMHDNECTSHLSCSSLFHRPQWRLTDSAGNASASYAYYGEGRRARSVGEGEGVNSTPRRLEDWRVPDIDDWPPALASTLSARHATDEGYRASMLSGSGCREREPGALGVTRTRDVDDYYTGKEERPNHQQYNEQRGGVSSLKHQAKASL